MTNSIFRLLGDAPPSQREPKFVVSGIVVMFALITVEFIHGLIYYRLILNCYDWFQKQGRLYLLWVLIAICYWVAFVVAAFVWGVLRCRKGRALHIMRRLVDLSLGDLIGAALLATVGTALENPLVRPSLTGIGFGFSNVIVLILACVFVLKGIGRLDSVLTQEQGSITT